MKNPWWKLGLILAVTVWALFFAWPREGRPFLNMSLGLDLKGGSHLVMQVVTDDAVKAAADAMATRVAEKLRKEGFPTVRVSGADGGQVIVSDIPAGRGGDVEAAIKDDVGSWSTSSGAGELRIQMPPSEMDLHRDNAVKQALTTIRNRVDAFGVSETNIQRLGGDQRDRILVELPGVEDPSRVKGLIQTQARLELRSAYYRGDGMGPFRGRSKEEVAQMLGGQLPTGVEVLPYQETDRQTGKQAAAPEWMAVERSSVITGADLADARRGQGQFGGAVVDFQLHVNAVDRFAKFTRTNVGRQMPIVLDDKIISAPRINSEIGMRGMIEGNFTPQTADDLALQLRAGALPARVNTIEERTVGPSLGKDSIDAGVRASYIGSLAVCVFMLIYYRRSGINAIVALVLNLLILAAVMSGVGAVLTLPGIAGYALTVGMAVDSNVLIFERIREELRHGRSVPAAVEQGFAKALSAILDTHVTTIVSALFLFNYGTGPVKGFAVSLTVGLLANLFTALVVSRFIFDVEIRGRQVKHLSI